MTWNTLQKDKLLTLGMYQLNRNKLKKQKLLLDNKLLKIRIKCMNKQVMTQKKGFREVLHKKNTSLVKKLKLQIRMNLIFGLKKLQINDRKLYIKYDMCF